MNSVFMLTQLSQERGREQRAEWEFKKEKIDFKVKRERGDERRGGGREREHV